MFTVFTVYLQFTQHRPHHGPAFTEHNSHGSPDNIADIVHCNTVQLSLVLLMREPQLRQIISRQSFSNYPLYTHKKAEKSTFDFGYAIYHVQSTVDTCEYDSCWSYLSAPSWALTRAVLSPSLQHDRVLCSVVTASAPGLRTMVQLTWHSAWTHWLLPAS